MPDIGLSMIVMINDIISNDISKRKYLRYSMIMASDQSAVII